MKSLFELLHEFGEPTRLDPDVIVDFIFNRGLLFIAVQNIGLRPAYNISVLFDKSLKGLQAPDKKDVTDIALFKKISFMPPGKEIRTFLDTSEAYFAREEPTDITTTISFENEKGNTFKNVINHNLEIYRDIGYVTVEGKPIPLDRRG